MSKKAVDLTLFDILPSLKNYENTIKKTMIKKKAVPFVKWAGGKRSIIQTLLDNLPDKFNDYYEPFVGGGALFFSIFENNLSNSFFLSDLNSELMITYKVIQKKPKELIKLLRYHAKEHSINKKDYYYKIRSQHKLKNPVEVAARLIYLNRTCYNGLYRVNKKNEFNVPIGRYKNPNIIQEENIIACHYALQSVNLSCKEYYRIKPEKNDFVYFDPPYFPLEENSFTSYTKFDFMKEHHIQLRDFALQLHKKGVKVMISNSNSKFIEQIYKCNPFNFLLVKAPRLVNCKKDGREPINELIIKSY